MMTILCHTCVVLCICLVVYLHLLVSTCISTHLTSPTISHHLPLFPTISHYLLASTRIYSHLLTSTRIYSHLPTISPLSPNILCTHHVHKNSGMSPSFTLNILVKYERGVREGPRGEREMQSHDIM